MCNRCGDKYCEDSIVNCPKCGEHMLCDASKCDACYNPYDNDWSGEE